MGQQSRRLLRRGGAGLAAGLVLVACAGDPEPETTTPDEPTATQTTEPAPETTEPTEDPAGLGAMGVSAGDPAAVEAGMGILQAGGNAVDAAIATAFAVAVVEPFASGIGGGGAALVLPTDGEHEAYDYREVVAADGVVPASGTGIPGFVAGMAALHEDHGELEWAELLEPAIALAQGHPVAPMLATRMRSDYGPGAISGLDHFHSGGAPLAAGEVLVQSELGETMQTLADDGAASFYTGSLAAELTAVPGIDEASLANYAIQRSEPVRGPFGDHEILAASPPLPGAALIQMLQVAEALGAGRAEPGSAEYIDAISQAWLIADSSVATQLGDPDFVTVPVDELTDPARNAALVGAEPAAADQAGALPPPEAGNTTHLTVVDETGTTVSMTNTITHFWGSGDYVNGFFLNDQLSRFEAIGTNSQNVPEPGRRSVSWSLPAAVLDEQGRPVLALGTPGGGQIPNILANVLARWVLHDQPLADAVAAERFHLEGSTLRVEAMPADAEALRGMGYALEVVDPQIGVFGSVQALEVDHEAGEIVGAADSRREADYAVEQP